MPAPFETNIADSTYLVVTRELVDEDRTLITLRREGATAMSLEDFCAMLRGAPPGSITPAAIRVVRRGVMTHLDESADEDDNPPTFPTSAGYIRELLQLQEAFEASVRDGNDSAPGSEDSSDEEALEQEPEQDSDQNQGQDQPGQAGDAVAN